MFNNTYTFLLETETFEGLAATNRQCHIYYFAGENKTV